LKCNSDPDTKEVISGPNDQSKVSSEPPPRDLIADEVITLSDEQNSAPKITPTSPDLDPNASITLFEEESKASQISVCFKPDSVEIKSYTWPEANVIPFTSIQKIRVALSTAYAIQYCILELQYCKLSKQQKWLSELIPPADFDQHCCIFFVIQCTMEDFRVNFQSLLRNNRHAVERFTRTDFEDLSYYNIVPKALSKVSNEPSYVTFPDKGKDAIMVTEKDLTFLKPGEFLNDTIIDFYLKYLHHHASKEIVDQVYIFNTFFYTRLSSVVQPHLAYKRVAKWTSNVNIFEKDYLIIPINHHFHWSLLIVVHPKLYIEQQLRKANDQAQSLPKRVFDMTIGKLVNRSSSLFQKQPAMLYMDSLLSSDNRIYQRIRDYLTREYEAKYILNSPSEPKIDFKELNGVCVKTPQQTNFCDCGLFILQYVESFLNAPFAPTQKEIEDHLILKYDWFSSDIVSQYRLKIQSHLKTLHSVQN
jgi:hypothetical protein